ncbi:MAG: peptide/nickel transport system permease protein [Frankiales bacterium]|jgi:peptide/nickel transport system permease protein|nr:peptide/nickel transport system permease protein [Frankiales bacterium]MDX6244977.1 peptide/nickel transport system permease protein [Frankiales bacterium]
MPTETATTAPSLKAGPLRTLRRALEPVREARGLPKWTLYAGAFIVVVFVVMAVFAPLLSPYGFDQYQSSSGARFPKSGPPSGAHPFGTNVQATDVLAHIIYGSRTALEVIVLAVLFSLVIGVPLGLYSGYFGGWVDRVLVLVMDAMFAFPSLLLAILVAVYMGGKFTWLGPGFGGVMSAALSITVVYVPQYFRVIRNSVISVREEPYVEAAQVLGARPRTVIGRYVFGNVVQNVPVIATLNAADALLTLAGLGFLGYGVQPSQAAEWGYDLQRSLEEVSSGVWWTSVYPGLAIVLLVTGLTLVGESLNDMVNPTLRRRRLLPVTISDTAEGEDG